MFKTFQSSIKSFDDEQLILKHWISTESQDDGGDIMAAEGMTLRGNIVVDFEHGKDPVKGVEPIAKSLGIEVGYNDQGVKGLIATTQFFPDEEGRRLYQKAKEMYMPNWSIEWEPIEKSKIKGGTYHSRWKLLAYSLVKLGMNKDATTDNNLKFIAKEGAPMEPETKGAQQPPEQKSLANTVGLRVARNALDMAHSAMIDEMHCKVWDDKCKDEAEVIADSLTGQHSEILKEHITNFVKCYRAMQKEARPKSLSEFKAMFAAQPVTASPASESKSLPTETVSSPEVKTFTFAAPEMPAQIAVDPSALSAGVEGALGGLIKSLTGKKY